jgi:hypothetical protein
MRKTAKQGPIPKIEQQRNEATKAETESPSPPTKLGERDGGEVARFKPVLMEVESAHQPLAEENGGFALYASQPRSQSSDAKYSKFPKGWRRGFFAIDGSKSAIPQCLLTRETVRVLCHAGVAPVSHVETRPIQWTTLLWGKRSRGSIYPTDVDGEI